MNIDSPETIHYLIDKINTIKSELDDLERTMWKYGRESEKRDKLGRFIIAHAAVFDLEQKLSDATYDLEALL